MTNWLSANKTSKFLGIHPQTLRTWDLQGKITTIRTPGNQRLYDVEPFQSNTISEQDEKLKIVYARVSSSHQREDLARQVKLLQKNYPHHTVITDIGSGLNFKRKGLQRLLQHVFQGNVEQIVIAHRDRLTRVAFELFESIFQHFSTKLLVHDKKCSNSKSFADREREVVEDILAINTFYITRMQGQRAASHGKGKERIKEDKKVEDNDEKRQTLKASGTSIDGTTECQILCDPLVL